MALVGAMIFEQFVDAGTNGPDNCICRLPAELGAGVLNPVRRCPDQLRAPVFWKQGKILHARIKVHQQRCLPFACVIAARTEPCFSRLDSAR